MKKKKKKKKTPFDLDGALNEAEGDNETPEPAKDDNLDDLDLENFGKKKKKKKKVDGGDEEKGDKEKDESDDIDLSDFGKKKKPKKKKNINLDELKEALDDDNKENGEFILWFFSRVKFPNLVFKKADQGSEIVQDQGVSKINIGGKHLTLHAWLLFHEFVYEFCHFTSFSVF